MDVAINSANRPLGIIARSFKNKNSHTIVLLYKSFVPPSKNVTLLFDLRIQTRTYVNWKQFKKNV